MSLQTTNAFMWIPRYIRHTMKLMWISISVGVNANVIISVQCHAWIGSRTHTECEYKSKQNTNDSYEWSRLRSIIAACCRPHPMYMPLTRSKYSSRVQCSSRNRNKMTKYDYALFIFYLIQLNVYRSEKRTPTVKFQIKYNTSTS